MAKECVGIETFMDGCGKEVRGSRALCCSFALSVLMIAFHSNHPTFSGMAIFSNLSLALSINGSFVLWLI